MMESREGWGPFGGAQYTGGRQDWDQNAQDLAHVSTSCSSSHHHT